MKKTLSLFIALALFALCLASPPTAKAAPDVTTYDANITAIFGGGNPNGGWTASTDAKTGVTVALRGKNRTTASTANVDGVYPLPLGLATATRAFAQIEFSVDTGASPSSAYDVYLEVDSDPSVGISYEAPFSVLIYGDNSFGDSATPNGGGIEPGAMTLQELADTYPIQQNSENLVFGPYPHDPFQNAFWSYRLTVYKKGHTDKGAIIAQVEVTLMIGVGGETVADLIADIAAVAENHGDYVKQVTKLLNDLYKQGVLTKEERDALKKEAAQSDVGK